MTWATAVPDITTRTFLDKGRFPQPRQGYAVIEASRLLWLTLFPRQIRLLRLEVPLFDQFNPEHGEQPAQMVASPFETIHQHMASQTGTKRGGHGVSQHGGD